MDVRPTDYAVHLHIERLVLDGLGPLDRAALGGAVQSELARLFTEGGAPPAVHRDARLPRLDGGHFDAAPGMGAEAVGKQVARCIYGGLSR